jgi:hypothetical protein
VKPRSINVTISLLLALELALLVLPQQASAYSNYPLNGDWKTGGPHRTINEFALERFIQQKKTDPILSRYDFSDEASKVSGPRIGEPGLFLRGNLTGAEDKGESFQWWVKEGGYSADEPELYASFRHFYDPRYKEVGAQPYLTDHIDQLGSYLRFIATVSAARGDVITAAMLAEIGRNPEVDARDWAINGSAHSGWGENEYCWNKGVQYIQQAFVSTDPVKKSKLFAQAWRALGETMHLLADMTMPSHVRNDSHPAFNIDLVDLVLAGMRNPDPNVGLLKGDPYETWVQESMVRRVGKANIDPEMRQYLDQSRDPLDLFDRVAMFTNMNFFSAETISGVDPLSGTRIHNANGMPDYPSPRLENLSVNKNRQYVKTIGSHTDVCMALPSWLSEIGWGIGYPRVTRNCVESQASVLVPVAVAGNVKLIDWFIPRVRVEITSVDTASRTLQGAMTHEPYGAYPTKMNFSTAANEFNPFRLNDSPQDFDDYKVQVENGTIRLTYGDKIARNIENALARGNATLSLVIDMGGIGVRSNDFDLTKSTPTPTRTLALTPVPLKTDATFSGEWVLEAVLTFPEPAKDWTNGCYYNHQVSIGDGAFASSVTVAQPEAQSRFCLYIL